MVKIFGSPQSSSGRCYWCLEEVGLQYEAQSISFKDQEHKSESFLKINPNGKVPALIDGDFVLSESMAINFYLAEKHKPELLGKNLEDKAKVRQWTFWAIADLQPPLINIFIQKNFVPEPHKDQSVIEKAEQKLPSMLESLDKKLENKNFIVGDSFTLADLNVNSVVSICIHINFDLSPYKNIVKWLEVNSQRPAFQKYLSLCQ